MEQFNIKGLELDPTKKRMFREFLTFTIEKDKPLNFQEFRKNCGISRVQWDQFRSLNCGSNINWSVE